MKTTSKTTKAICVALVFSLVSSSGTAVAWETPKMFRLDNTWPFRDKDKPQLGTPVRMVGAWTDTVMTQPGQKPQRGFGGRVMFYDKEGKKPILVEGQMVVYAFDETDRDPTDNKPTRRYVFPDDQMSVHQSKSELGASYSFWLPWDEVGGPKTKVSLICRFEPKSGGIVTGEQTKHLLPGPEASTLAKAAGAKNTLNVPEGVPARPPRQTLEDVRAQRNAELQAKQTSFDAPATGLQTGAIGNGAPQTGTTPARHMTAATISLPQNYQLPDMAAMNTAAQPPNYQPTAITMSQPQHVPNAMPGQMQAMPIQGYNMGAAAGMPQQQQMGVAQAYAGSSMPQQVQAAPPTSYPGVQAYGQVPTGAPPAGQIQQQAYLQPVVQPPITQPQPIRQMQAPVQTWPQVPTQIGMPPINSPAQVQYR